MSLGRILPVLWTALLLLPAAVSAQSGGADENPASAADSSESATAVDPDLQAKLASPRATLRTFLRAAPAEAVVCLNLSEIGHSDAAEAKGREYAYKLKAVIDRIWLVDYAKVPERDDSQEPYILASSAKHLSGEALADARRIVIAPDAQGLWRFTPGTVAAVDEMWSRWREREEVAGVQSQGGDPFPIWLEEQFPASLRDTTLLLPDYQWIALAGLVVLGFVVDLVVRLLLAWGASTWMRVFRRERGFDVDRKLWRPLGLLAQALVWYGGTKLIGLPPWALTILLVGLKFFSVVVAVWAAFAAINLLGAILMRRAERTGSKFDDLLIPLITKSLKCLAVLVGVLMCGEAFNLPMRTLLGGTAIGGMALALASQDAVSNLFGSMTVLIDRPFEVGDWIVTDSVEGTVETVGFRSTRVRTFYNSQITLPNSKLTTAVVDNMGRRRYRRIKAMLGVQYDTTPDQIDAFCEGIRELLRRHPYTAKDNYHVYLNEFSDSSLNILLYCFLECPDWAMELREKHRLYLDILRLAQSLGVQFAFPTRTLHMFNEAPPEPAERLDAPEQIGIRHAAQIAGRPLTGDARPGHVEYRGPSDLDDDSSE